MTPPCIELPVGATRRQRTDAVAWSNSPSSTEAEAGTMPSSRAM